MQKYYHDKYVLEENLFQANTEYGQKCALPIAIEIRHLTKRFPRVKRYRELFMHPFRRHEVTVLRDMNIQIKEGEIFCLLGPNGAGKTTLLKILCGLIIPSEGTAFINGINTTLENQKIKKEIGFVLNEERSFYWRLTGRQNLRFFATLNNMSNIDSQRRIDAVLEITDLNDVANEMFKNYSSGMKQRLAIARALLTDPKIIIMDEPTRSLDPLSIVTLKDFLIKRLNKKERKTLLIATHDVKLVEGLEDCTVGIINKGRLLFKDSITNIKNGLYKKASLDEIFPEIIRGKG